MLASASLLRRSAIADKCVISSSRRETHKENFATITHIQIMHVSMRSQLGEGIKQSIENFVIHTQFCSLGLFFKSYNTKRVTSVIELCKQRQVSMLVQEQNATLN